MKKIEFSFLAVLCTSIMLFCLAAPVKSHAAEKHIYDDGGFFTESEIDALEAEYQQYEEEAGVDLIFITVRDIYYTYAEYYLDEYADELISNGSAGSNTVLMLYGENDRFCWIQGYGTTEYYINSKRIDTMLDQLESLFTEGDYQAAGSYFAEKAAYYAGRDPKRDTIFVNPLFHLAAAVLIGAAAVGFMAVSSGGRVTTNRMTYLDASNSGITASRDQYIRTSVTKRRRPQQGTGSGGRRSSSGGRSRSSGGRRF